MTDAIMDTMSTIEEEVAKDSIETPDSNDSIAQEGTVPEENQESEKNVVKDSLRGDPNQKRDPKDPLFFECPHCKGDVIILPNEVNCGIFRHARYKDGTYVKPHTKKDLCEKLVAENKVYGCCKPFRLQRKTKRGEYQISACGYI